LTPPVGGRIAVVQSMPADLTPADTSSTVPPTLASALRRRLAGVEEILLPAQAAQAALATVVLASGTPTVTIALRTPRDLLAYPSARTHVCTYGILPPSMEALAAALLGEAPFVGRLPAAIAGLYPRGHGLAA
jgi:beta-N-acetylhexosaminidase